MSCCRGKTCGGAAACSPEGGEERQTSAAEAWSRYPEVSKRLNCWASPAPPAEAQFQADRRPAAAQEREKEAADSPPFTFSGEHLAACNFPLGGFGAGQVHLQGDGTLQGWYVLNQKDKKGDMDPHPCQDLPACFFAVSAAAEGEGPQNFLLASPENYTLENCGLPSFYEAHVTPHSVQRLQNLPGIRGLTLKGRYPIADVSYDIAGFPLSLSLEAMSPLVPGEVASSAFPGAIFTFAAKNNGAKPVTCRLMQAQMNFVGWDGLADAMSGETPFWKGNVNTPICADGLTGLAMTSTSVASDSHSFGSLCIAAAEQEPTNDDPDFVMVGGSHPGAVGLIVGAASEEALWEDFVNCREQPALSSKATAPSEAGHSYCGGVVQSVVVAPGASETLRFILTWHFANRAAPAGFALPPVIGAKYSTWFADAHAVAKALQERSDSLLTATRSYRDEVYGSTLPENMIQSAAGRASLLGAPTMFWTKDGIVLGYEGNHCCPLNCSHVYGYGILLERLFPELAQDIQYSAFVRTYKRGVGVTMRFGTQKPAIDGAFASIIKTYLAVQQGDSALSWLPKVWPNVKDMMDIVAKHFDVDGDGCIRCAQQDTYDTAMFEANTFIGSYYVTALRAAARMAELMKEPDLAKKFSDRAALASKSYERICWDESFGYYTADVTIKTCQYSYGPGCFMDQLCAAGLSFACGLGYIFEEAHEARARASIFKHNRVHKPPFEDKQKHFFNGDTGHTTCSYPNGKLGDGMRDDLIVSTGWTYPVIAGLLHDRNLSAAESMNDMQRQRQDGRNRSPWNEPECNTHYIRMLSGWGLYDQCCGLLYDCTKQFLAFDPRYNAEDFRCFFAAEGGWGRYTQEGTKGLSSGKVSVVALHGSVLLKQLGVLAFKQPNACSVDLDGKVVAASLTDVSDLGKIVVLESSLTITKGSVMTVTLRTATGISSAD